MRDDRSPPPRELDGAIWRASTSKEVSAELEFHVEMLTRELVASGMSPADAAAEARRRFGDFSHATTAARRAAANRDRSMRFSEQLATLRQDATYAARQLVRAPGFTIVAILTLALGIGANSAIFSVINSVALKPLPYPQSERLMFITSQFPSLGFDKFWVSPPEYFDYTENTTAFGTIGAFTAQAINISDGSNPERVSTVFATANLFDVLGVRPQLGRVYTAEEDLPDAPSVVVLSHELWQRSFGGDPAVLERTIDVNGLPTRVIGVMPPGFDVHDAQAQAWRPLRLDPSNRQNRGSHFLYLIGRLAPSATQVTAETELRTMLARWGELAGGSHAPNDSTHRFQMEPLRDEVIGNVKTALWVLQGAVGLVLLIACANIANLLLARAETRHKEFAIRTALGAGRGRLLRQFMVEGLALSILGGLAGIALAYWGLRAILAANPESIPRTAEIGLDPTVLIFTAAVALVTGLLFGLAPLLHVRDRTVARAIRDGSARTTSDSARARVRRALVVGEVALAVMLVVGAGLLLRSFWNLTSVDPGFDRSSMVTFGTVMPSATYPEPERRTQFVADLAERLRRLPGVEGAAAMSGLPPNRRVNANDTAFEGITWQEGMPHHNVDYYQVVTADYFPTMRISMREGRAFEPADAGGPPVVVINETLARTFYPNESPIGRRIRPDFGPDVPWFTIVGVAADVKQGGLDQQAGTELYALYDQLPRHLTNLTPTQMNLVLRSTRPIGALAPEIRQIMSSMDATLPIIQMRTMDEVFGDSLTRQRFLSQLLLIFAVVALLLAAVGTYGILAYMVNERGREIGIRMALGAGRGSVLGMVLRQGFVLAGVGIVAGLGGAFFLSRLAESLLYGVSPVDPATFAAVAAMIAAVALLACVIPARRATRVDPLEAIRAE